MKEGCHFAYCGNQPGMDGEHTFCPSCKKAVIKRYGFRILENNLSGGKCIFCQTVIPGVWG
jgi:pyruvate formate lyase activating enzyme